MKVMLMSREQFGYQTDFYMYAKHLRTATEIVFVCLDHGREKIQMNGVQVHYAKSNARASRLSRYLSLLICAIRNHNGADAVLVKYFKGCSILIALLGREGLTIDIRTLSVDPGLASRLLSDLLTKIESLFAKQVTVVSEPLGRRLWNRKIKTVPLGAEVTKKIQEVDLFPRGNEAINLLYIGTLHNRNIEVLVDGLARQKRNRPTSKFRLTIVGSGFDGEIEKLNALAADLRVSRDVKVLGYIRHDKLGPILGSAHLGIVQVPDAPYYRPQPSTKLYEYWAAGLPVLASRYAMSELEVTPETGLLYEANAMGFETALNLVSSGAMRFSSQAIGLKASEHEWSNIVATTLFPALKANCRVRKLRHELL